MDDAIALSAAGLGDSLQDGSVARLIQLLQEGVRTREADYIGAVQRVAGDSLRSNRWLASQSTIVGELVHLARHMAVEWQVARRAADAMAVLATTTEGRAALRLQGASQVLLRLVIAGTSEHADDRSCDSSEDSDCSGSDDNGDEADGQSSISWRAPSGWSDWVDTLNRLQLEQHRTHAAERVPSLTDYITVGERERLAKCHQLMRCPTRKHRVAVLLALLAAETTGSEQSGPVPASKDAASVVSAVGIMCSSQAFWNDNWERAPCTGSLLGGGRAVVEGLRRRFSLHSENGMRAWLSEGHPSVGSMPWCDVALLRGASLVQPCLWRHQEPGAVGPQALPMQCGDDYRMVRVSAASGEQELFDTDDADPFGIADWVMRHHASGYSLVVNSLQLRNDDCATLASALARQICDRPETGVVHVGVNLYATPSESQGLVPHYDDHSVFVIQLEGQKRWTLWPEKCGARLPRLRDERTAPQLSAESALQYVLQPGHWLYIPRGWPHAATAEGATDAALYPSVAAGSVHLSLSVDLERPFDMAGALHIALWCFCLQRPYGGNADAASGSSKRQRTASDSSVTVDRRRFLSTECWLHAHIDLVASAPQSVLLRRSAFFRRSEALGTGDEALAAAACCWADFVDTVDGLTELAARFDAADGPGSEDALAWLQLLSCDDTTTIGSSSRGCSLLPCCSAASNLTDLSAAVEECEQLRCDFLAWVCSSDPSRWAMIVEVAETIGVQLRRGSCALAAALAVVRAPQCPLRQ